MEGEKRVEKGNSPPRAGSFLLRRRRVWGQLSVTARRGRCRGVVRRLGPGLGQISSTYRSRSACRVSSTGNCLTRRYGGQTSSGPKTRATADDVILFTSLLPATRFR